MFNLVGKRISSLRIEMVEGNLPEVPGDGLAKPGEELDDDVLEDGEDQVRWPVHGPGGDADAEEGLVVLDVPTVHTFDFVDHEDVLGIAAVPVVAQGVVDLYAERIPLCLHECIFITSLGEVVPEAARCFSGQGCFSFRDPRVLVLDLFQGRVPHLLPLGCFAAREQYVLGPGQDQADEEVQTGEDDHVPETEDTPVDVHDHDHQSPEDDGRPNLLVPCKHENCEQQNRTAEDEW